MKIIDGSTNKSNEKTKLLMTSTQTNNATYNNSNTKIQQSTDKEQIEKQSNTDQRFIALKTKQKAKQKAKQENKTKNK